MLVISLVRRLSFHFQLLAYIEEENGKYQILNNIGNLMMGARGVITYQQHNDLWSCLHLGFHSEVLTKPSWPLTDPGSYLSARLGLRCWQIGFVRLLSNLTLDWQFECCWYQHASHGQQFSFLLLCFIQVYCSPESWHLTLNDCAFDFWATQAYLNSLWHQLLCER